MIMIIRRQRMRTWQATKAKQHFSQIIDGAEEEPQLVVRRGKPVGVVISYREFLKSGSLSEKKSLTNWLSDLKTINETEDEMGGIRRSDRNLPDWD